MKKELSLIFFVLDINTGIKKAWSDLTDDEKFDAQIKFRKNFYKDVYGVNIDIKTI